MHLIRREISGFANTRSGRSVDRQENHWMRGVALAVHGGLCLCVRVGATGTEPRLALNHKYGVTKAHNIT